DPVALRCREDLAPGHLFRVDALERGLIEARDRVPNVLLVVDRKALSTLLIDVGEVLARDVLASGLGELCHLRLLATFSVRDWRPRSRALLRPSGESARSSARSLFRSPGRDGHPPESPKRSARPTPPVAARSRLTRSARARRARVCRCRERSRRLCAALPREVPATRPRHVPVGRR